MLSYGLNRLGREFIINLRPYMVRDLRLRQTTPIIPYLCPCVVFYAEINLIFSDLSPWFRQDPITSTLFPLVLIRGKQESSFIYKILLSILKVGAKSQRYSGGKIFLSLTDS